MQAASSFTPSLVSIPLEDLNLLQARYKPMGLAARAGAVLRDAAPALETAERILAKLEEHKQVGKAIEKLRADHSLIHRMRSCEARNVLLDDKSDFIQASRNKIASWRKTMQRVADGEGVLVNGGGKEYIPSSDPIAMAIFGISHLGHYLSIAQLIIADISKSDNSLADEWKAAVAEMRRCATVISDYEFAAALTGQVH